MIPDVVVDVGNTRIKFGRCTAAPGVAELASLPPEDPTAWGSQIAAWGIRGGRFAMASVNPGRAATLRAWLEASGHHPVLIQDFAALPLRVDVDEPARVGIDRLLSATAAHRREPGRSLIVVAAGTAVTVDFVTAGGIFQGGAIFPGFGTMLHSLHQQTAQLPAIALTEPVSRIVGRNTGEAMRSGVFAAVVGGIAFLAERGRPTLGDREPKLFVTGGDGPLLQGQLPFEAEFVPTLTLEGIRLTAEALP